MFMNILKWKYVFCTFFCIKTNRNSLHNPNIINSTLLIKISKRNMTFCLIKSDWLDRCRYFLHKSKFLLPVFFIRIVDQLFKDRSSKSLYIPFIFCHDYALPNKSFLIISNRFGSGAWIFFPDRFLHVFISRGKTTSVQ